MATKKPKGLGLGLEALLGPTVRDAADAGADGDGDAAHAARSTQLQPGKYQPRTRMDEGALYELAESIKAQGVMQPILVRAASPSGDGERATRSSPASAASAPRSWPASTRCRCWCATCPTRPRRRWR